MKVILSIILLLYSNIIHGAPHSPNEKLLYAIMEDQYATAQDALIAKADPNAFAYPFNNEYGQTLFHIAIQKGTQDIIKLLLDNGANPNITDKSRDTSLHYAAMAQDPKIIRLLIKNGAEVNAIDAESQTALFLIAKNRHRDIFEVTYLLLKAGAKVNIPNRDELTPLQLLRHTFNRTPEISNTLLDTGKLLAIFSDFNHLKALTKEFDEHNEELERWIEVFTNNYSLWQQNGQSTPKLEKIRTLIRSNDGPLYELEAWIQLKDYTGEAIAKHQIKPGAAGASMTYQ